MPASIQFSESFLAAYPFVLLRFAGCLTIIQFPGFRFVPAPVKVIFAMMMALPATQRCTLRSRLDSAMDLLLAAASEVLLGVAAAIVVAVVGDILTMAVQSFSLQAGFSYASTIDPGSQADSTVLQAMAQILSSLLFLSSGLLEECISAIGRSLDRIPPGTAFGIQASPQPLITFTATSLELGLRLALPIALILLVTDLTLALLSRINSHFPLMTLSFTVKLLGSLMGLALLAGTASSIYQLGAWRAITLIRSIHP